MPMKCSGVCRINEGDKPVTQGLSPFREVAQQLARLPALAMQIAVAVHRLYGATRAERALDRVPCDLIVVKRPGFHAPDLD